jgi:glycerol-3-phosphate dehydrogenase (NAD(P)+)
MNTQQPIPIAILGAGSWGTALALYLARRGHIVHLWSIEIAEIASQIAERENTQYLPGFQFPALIQPTANLVEAVNQVQNIIIAVPSIGFRHTVSMLKPIIIPDFTRIICATKGLDEETGQLLHEVVEEVLGDDHPFAILSGPSFAREVAAGLPAALVIASCHPTFRQELIKHFHSDIFRLCPSDDVIGTEVGGIVKNVIALATGISDGLKLGANARSALITQGLTEMMHLGTALGGKSETFMGLSGLGDLILTCTDNQSRNRRLGLALGEGHDINSAEQNIGQAVEGKRNAHLVHQLAERYQITMPVCDIVWQIVQGKVTAKEVGYRLLGTG